MPRALHICALIKDDGLTLKIKGIALRMGWQFSSARTQEELNFTLARLTPAPDLLLLEHYHEDLLSRYSHLARVVMEDPCLSSDPDIIFLSAERFRGNVNHSGTLVKAITAAANLKRVRALVTEQPDSRNVSLVLPNVPELLRQAAATPNPSDTGKSTTKPLLEQPHSGAHRVGVLCLGVDHARELFADIDEPMTEICHAILARARQHIDKTAGHNHVGFHRDYTLIALLPGVDRARIEALAERLLEAFQTPLECGRTTAYLSISLGLLLADASTDPERALALVEHAMHEAMDQGGNRLLWAQQDLNLMARIPLAMQRNEFSVHFQPQWSLDNASLTGAEALLRWYGLDIGEIQPNRFIRLAESAGSMIPLGDLVIRKACQQASTWLEQLICPISLSLNISPQQLRSPDLARLLRQTIERHGLNSHDLELEIDYIDFQSLWQQQGAVMRDLKSLGVRFALDKVGTALIDALALKSWPVSTIKLQQPLIHALAVDPDALRITNRLIGMAQSLGIRSVAVGVEDLATHKILSNLGCDSAQGHFYCKALPPLEFASLLRNNARVQVDDES